MSQETVIAEFKRECALGAARVIRELVESGFSGDCACALAMHLMNTCTFQIGEAYTKAVEKRTLAEAAELGVTPTREPDKGSN